MKRIISEPLFHFLVLGAAIFATYSFLSKDTVSKPGEIVVTQGKIENLMTTFGRTWQRPPTEQELQGLIQDYVREEVACREAVALGLDRDDTIIRRRLRQKLEFVSDDLAAQAEPTEAELHDYLKAHAEDFKTEPTFTFRQVYLNPQKHGANLESDAERMLAELRQAGDEIDLASLGDSFLLEHRFENTSASEVMKIFGEMFATKLRELTPGEWQGPVESGYGAHLVLVTERIEGHMPSFEEVRDEVRREWANAKRLEANEKFYQTLLQRYTVIIEEPQPASGDQPLAEAQR